jgi:hypothetical protein
MAATFSSTAALDLVTAFYNAAVGAGCWFAAGGNHATPHQLQQQQLAAASGQQKAPGDAAVQSSWGLKMVWSVAVVLTLNVSTWLAVWLLRLQVASAAKQQQSEVCSSTGTAQLRSSAGDEANAAGDTLYARAGFRRQQLLALWIVQAAVLDVLCACGAVVTPGMMVRAWGLQGWAQNAACILGLGVKAWMYQVRAGHSAECSDASKLWLAWTGCCSSCMRSY